MRYLLAAALMMFGCAPGPVGPVGERGPQGVAGPAGDVAPLLAEIAALRGELEAVRREARVKVPHSVIAETGEDLGVYLDAETVFSEKLGAPIRWKPVAWLYASTDCTGEALAPFAEIPRPAAYATGPSGELFRVKPVTYTVASSMRQPDGTCREVASDSARSVDLAGMTITPAAVQSVIVEMR